jgi:hypothetical protein
MTGECPTYVVKEIFVLKVQGNVHTWVAVGKYL